MKQILLLSALFAVALSCRVSSDAPLATKTITISLSGVQTGDMTKALDPTALLGSTAPVGGVTLSLVSTTNALRRYTATPGQALTVPLDTYDVTGSYLPSSSGNIFSKGKVYARPPYSASGRITVTEDTDAYSVAATYDCFALVIDYSECEKYGILGAGGSMIDFTWFTDSEGMGLAYIVGDWNAAPLRIDAVPQDKANYEQVRYELVTDPSYQGVLVENGKWYAFGPNGVQTGGADIGIDLPGWERGNE